MSQHQLISYEPKVIHDYDTHMRGGGGGGGGGGSLLDHVNINRQTLQKISIEAIQAVSVYFSNHQAVKFKLRSL